MELAGSSLVRALRAHAPLLAVRGSQAAQLQGQPSGIAGTLWEQLLEDSSAECEASSWQRWMPVLVCLQRAEPSTIASLFRLSCHTVACGTIPVLQGRLVLHHLARLWGAAPSEKARHLIRICGWVVGQMSLRVSRAASLVAKLVSVESCLSFGVSRSSISSNLSGSVG